MAISVTDPISSAIQRAKWITFQPFDLGKWFTLGFCAFLGSLGQGGFNFNVPGGGGGGGSGGTTLPAGNPVDSVTGWISSHVVETALIAGLFVLALFSIAILILWLSSRGHFMFMDGVANNTAEVAAPWKRYRRLGNSLFRFRIFIMGVFFLAIALIGGVATALAWRDIQSNTFGAGAIAALVVAILLVVPTFIAIILVDWCTVTFVTTIMYARDATVSVCWREFRQNVLNGHVGVFVLFLLMTFVLGMAVGIASMLLGCLTLCIGFLPYLSSVITLPLTVFMRSYSIYFLQQFNPEYAIMKDPPPPGIGFPVIMPPLPLPPTI